MTAASSASAMRAASGASDLRMARIAWATTATATSCSPCTAPSPSLPVRCACPRAKASMSSAEGRVNPVQAASPPSHPARSSPSAKPTWLLAGPGSDCARATISAKLSSAAPAAALDELGVEVAQMRDGSAEGDAAQTQKGRENFARAAGAWPLAMESVSRS